MARIGLSIVVGLMALAAASARAQTARDIVGTWSLVSAVGQHGSEKVDMFGATPNGTVLFGADGHYALVYTRRDLPQFASRLRSAGTPEENRAVLQGSIAHFGTYEIDGPNRMLVLHIEGSTFPNWVGAEQHRAFSLAGDVLTYISPGSTGWPDEITLRRVKSP